MYNLIKFSAKESVRNTRQAQECYLASLTPVMALAQRFMKKINSSIALKYKKRSQ